HELLCVRKTSRRGHAVRTIERDDYRAGAGGRIRAGGPGGGATQQYPRANSGSKQQQIAQPTTLRSLDRRFAKQVDGRERHLGRHIAPQEVEDDREGDRDCANEERWIEKGHCGAYDRSKTPEVASRSYFLLER